MLASLLLLQCCRHAPTSSLRSDRSSSREWKKVLPSATDMAYFLTFYKSCFQCDCFRLSEDCSDGLIYSSNLPSPGASSLVFLIPLSLAFWLYFSYYISKWSSGLWKSFIVRRAIKRSVIGHKENAVSRGWQYSYLGNNEPPDSLSFQYWTVKCTKTRRGNYMNEYSSMTEEGN